ncbi:MAG: hypothetical protein K9M57_06820 [Phycisphaerae bacterium]|nr:hypothetical protein [Phycisphaerae bacterium]
MTGRDDYQKGGRKRPELESIVNKETFIYLIYNLLAGPLCGRPVFWMTEMECCFFGLNMGVVIFAFFLVGAFVGCAGVRQVRWVRHCYRNYEPFLFLGVFFDHFEEVLNGFEQFLTKTFNF